MRIKTQKTHVITTFMHNDATTLQHEDINNEINERNTQTCPKQKSNTNANKNIMTNMHKKTHDKN